MKKFWSGLFIVCLVLVFAGCSSSKEEDNLTMDKFIEAFNNSGEDISSGTSSDDKKIVDEENKPIVEMIEANDGVIFYLEGNPVKIYEYESIDKLKKAKKKYSLPAEGDIIRERFLLETNSEKAKEIFNSVK
ncbi:hypothetical protein [Paenibacillus sp. IHBB 3054]|uniref:hypothetical protein n=1 Tax=Paenibacillus sp. IHBB 3054 TaxID=3425689 RepID=UPI003F66FA41